MKNDLATSIVIAIVGVIIAFLACNTLMGDISPVSVKTVSGSFSPDVGDPNVEVFNYKAVNPTVEVYIGGDGANCSEFDSGGNCITDYNQNSPEPASGQGD